MLKENQVIIFPTDSLYSLAASVDDVKAIARIYEIKQRDRAKKLAVLFPDIESIKRIAYVDERAEMLMEKYFPGPLTLVLRTRQEHINEFISSTIGVRIPNHHLARQILKENGPLINSSVNTSNEDPLNDFAEIQKQYRGKVDIIYPNYEKILRVPSTVIDLTGPKSRILREGAIPYKQLQKDLGEINED